MSWVEFEFGDIVDKIKGGGTPSKQNQEYWNGDIFWASVKDMEEGKYRLSSTQDTITQIGLENSASNLIPKDTLIIATRMGLGRAFINEVDLTINQDLKAIFPKLDVVDTKFLLWWYVNNGKYIENLGNGATVKGIRLEQLKAIKIYLPPLTTQKRIASILSNYDDLIENNLKRIKLLEETAQNIYKEWFVNFRFPNYENTPFNEETGLPLGWEMKELNYLVELQQGFALNKKSGHHISIEKTDYPLLKISDLFNETETLFVKESIPKQFLVKSDEIIFSRTGQVGHAFMGRTGVIYNNCFRVMANKNIDTYFLFATLIFPSFIKNVKGLATGSAQPDLNHSAFKSIKIILPSLELQKTYSLLFQSNLKLKYNLKEQNQKLKEARDILLPRLMNRTIEV